MQNIEWSGGVAADYLVNSDDLASTGKRNMKLTLQHICRKLLQYSIILQNCSCFGTIMATQCCF